MVVFIVFLLFLAFLFNNPMSIIFLLVTCFLCIFLGASIYSEGIVRSDFVPIDVEIINSSLTTIDQNADRVVSFTVGEDSLVSLLAPTFFYGGFLGLIFTGLFVIRILRADKEEE